MGLIPEHIIGEIRDRTDIVAIVGQHVKLRKAGVNHKGLCPFHQEKSPSFNVNSDKGFFYCFGCQKKGDVFTFMMELEGRSFIEAAESLADRLGIIIPTDSTPSAGQRSRRSDMLKAAGMAREFFRRALSGDAGREARAYLESRQIGADVSEAFGLGYAPAEWGALGDHLRKSGVSGSIAEAAGLVIPRKGGNGTYDRFRDRLMCPVANSSGDCVGFSGRRLSSEEDAGAKYINSPENAIYKKSHLLFGLHLARPGFRDRGRAILVEGNFDVVSLHQAGFTETVAPLGTALTEEQAVRLRRLVPVVVLLFDGDAAGRKATLKSLQTLLGAGLEVKIARMPMGSDPDDLVKTGGSEALETLVAAAQPGVEYFIDNAWTEAGSSAHGRAHAIHEAAHVLKSVPDAAKRDLLIGQFAQSLGTDPATLRTHLRSTLVKERQERQDRHGRSSGQPTENNQVVRAPQPESHRHAPRRELDIVAILADHPELIKHAETLNVFSLLTDTRLRDMYSAVREGRPMLSETENLSPDMAERVLGGMYATVDSPAECLEAAVSRLVQMRRREGLAELQKQAELARRRGDADKARTLVSEILMIRKQVD